VGQALGEKGVKSCNTTLGWCSLRYGEWGNEKERAKCMIARLDPNNRAEGVIFGLKAAEHGLISTSL